MAESALWIGGAAFTYGGIDLIRKGFTISKDKHIEDSAASAIGISLIVIGLAIAVGSSIHLRTTA